MNNRTDRAGLISITWRQNRVPPKYERILFRAVMWAVQLGAVVLLIQAVIKAIQ